MAYLIILILAFAVVISGASGMLPYKQWLGSAQSDITKALFPKSEREIVIENLQKKADLIKTVLEKQTRAGVVPSKAELQQALDAIESSGVLLDNLKATEAEKKTVSESLIQNIISTFSSGESPPSPTQIPSSCKVVCSE